MSMDTEEMLRSAPPAKLLAVDDIGALVDITFAYRASRVIHTANQLDVFNYLAKGPAGAREVAEHCGCHLRSTELLLNACVALGLLVKSDGKYQNGPVADKHLVEGKSTYLRYQIEMQRRNFEASLGLPQAVRTNEAAAGTYHTPETAYSNIFQFHQAAAVLAPLLPGFLDLTGRRKLFAAGPAAETLAIKLVQKTPGLKATVFADREGTVKGTKELIARYGLSDRMTTQLGDYDKDSFGEGNDAVVVMNGPQVGGWEGNWLLAKKAYDSLVSGGLYAVAGYIKNNSKTAPRHTALWNVTSLVFNPAFEILSAQELEELLKEVGFVDPVLKVQPAPLFFRMMIARKP